jgi:hypothetical protein
MALLAASILMALLWLGWALTDTTAVFESSTQIEVSPDVSISPTVEKQGNVSWVKDQRKRWLEARFPATSYGSLLPGQEATVFLRGLPDAQALAALVIEVHDDSERRQTRVVLRITTPADTPDLLASAQPDRVSIAVGTTRPLDRVLPNLAPSSRPPAPDRARTRE